MNQWNICLTWWRAHAQELSHFSLSYRRYFLSDNKFWNQFPLHTHSPENLLFIWHFPRHCHFLFFLSFSSYHVYPWSTFMSEEASRWKKFLTRQGIVFHQKLLCSEEFDNVKECLSQEIMVLEKILVWSKSSCEYLLHNEETPFKTLWKVLILSMF